MIAGHARVSTAEQSPDHQVAAPIAGLFGVPRATVYGHLNLPTAGTPS